LPPGAAPGDVVAAIERLPRDLADWCGSSGGLRRLEEQHPPSHGLPQRARRAVTAPV
jgi:hypothetical protein